MAGQMIPWWRIELGDEEAEAAARAIRDRNVSQGPLTATFEEMLASRLGVRHVICTTSGTSALTMAALATGIGPGDEVVMPNRTWVATANAILMLGGKVRAADSLEGSLLVDVAALEQALTPRTRAVIPVHLNGGAVAMDAVLDLAERRNLVVIEDACQAFMSRDNKGRRLGTIGRFGCFSLGMAKLLSTGQGGFIACNDDNDAQLLRRIRNQGLSTGAVGERHNVRGGNFKFTDIQAAVGIAQLARLDGRIAHQLAIHRAYDAGLKPLRAIKAMPVNIEAGEVPLRQEILCVDRERFIASMREMGIECIVQSPCLDSYPFIGIEGTYPISVRYNHGLATMPSGPSQPLANVQAAIEAATRVDALMAV